MNEQAYAQVMARKRMEVGHEGAMLASKTIERAVSFATLAHKGQTRNGDIGLPYIVHPINVMVELWTYGVRDEGILAAAVLHDVLEDCPDIDVAVLEVEFGPRVAEIVKQLTCPPDEEKAIYMADFKYKSPEALLIKLVDRFLNIRDFLVEKDGYATKYAAKAGVLIELLQERLDEIANLVGKDVVNNFYGHNAPYIAYINAQR